MGDFISSHEIVIRSGLFIFVLLCMTVLEILSPRRTLTVGKTGRWLNNISLVVLDAVLLRLIFPAAAAGAALYCQQQGWGLLPLWQVPPLPALILAVVALDLAIYLQHVMFHAIPLLWRLHRVHHADLDIDVTTGLRFHPIEIILSMLFKFAVIGVTGASVTAVIIFEVVLNAMSMFSHGNIRLPAAVDRVLRSVVVTPDMHRVHHSIEEDETNSNFGFNLSVWDRLFGTYRRQPRAGHLDMTIGLSTFRDRRQCVYLPNLLVMPFIGRVTGYAINRRRWE